MEHDFFHTHHRLTKADERFEREICAAEETEKIIQTDRLAATIINTHTSFLLNQSFSNSWDML